MRLEKQLKADAATLLDDLVGELTNHANAIAKRAGLHGDTLCRLVVGGRIESVRRSAIKKMAYTIGEQLYRRYSTEKREASK